MATTNEIQQPKAEDMQVVLEAILARLQEIDATAASRGSFAAGIVYGQMHGLDSPVFENEIRLMKRALNLEEREIELLKPIEVTAEDAGKHFTIGDL
jgi:hypothetical protein